MRNKLCLFLLITMLFTILGGCDIKTNITNTANKTSTSSRSVNTSTKKTSTTTGTTSEPIDSFDKVAYEKGIEERGEFLLNYIISSKGNDYSSKYGFGIAALYIKLYEESGEEAYLKKGLENMNKCLTNYETSGNCFGVFQLNFAYGLFNKYLSGDLRDRFEKIIKTTKEYSTKPDTPNHTLMSAVACYLANQYFPNEIVNKYYGYLQPENDDPTASKAIDYVLDIYPVYGVVEFNSDTYFVCHYLPLLALAMCATDSVVKQKALMNLENALFTLAPIYLSGHMVVASERTYTPIASQNMGGQTNNLLWYYFGGVQTEYPTKSELNYAEGYNLGFAIYSDFIPNWISAAIASDRSEDYIHQELHTYNGKKGGETYYMSYMQSYISDDYGIFSSRIKIRGADYLRAYGDHSDFDNRYGNYRQQFNWGVRWITDNPSDLSTFSIQHVNYIDTDRSLKYGSSCYSQVFQYNKSVIGVFDIPSDYKYPSILIYEPDNYLAIIDESYEGRLFLHYGNVIIAFRLSMPFVNKIDEYSKVRTEPMTKGWFVCEIIDPASLDMDDEEPIDQLNYVSSMLYKNFRDVSYDYSGKTKVTYKSIDGTVMSMQFGGNEQDTNDSLNGVIQNFDYTTYPSQKNPWTNTAYGSKVITYNYQGHSYTFDFNKLETIEK